MDLSNTNWTKTQDVKVNECLAKILSSPIFAKAERQQRFLSYIMAETLQGRAEKLKGYTIGVEVFDREPSFDPAIDAIVRVEAARLRSKLREYYDGEGYADPVRFDLPKGHYAIHINWQEDVSSQDHSTNTNGISTNSHPQLIEDRPSLAVLPFANIGSDNSKEYFADGVVDNLIAMFSRLSGLFIISRQSSFSYKNTLKPSKQIAAELGVRYLLEGSVQHAANQVRVTAQLVDTKNGGQVWADYYDRELKDIFALQDELTQHIVRVLQIKLAGEEAELFGYKGTSSIEAHDILLQGIAQFRKYTRKSTNEAIALLTKAAEIDPDYAAVQAWLARAITFEWAMIWNTDPAILEQAFSYARSAVALDPQSPYAMSILGWVQLWRRNREESVSECRRAVALDPNNAEAYLFLSLALSSAGSAEEGLHYIEKAKRFTPTPAPLYEYAYGNCYYVLKQYKKAIAAFEQGCIMSPYFIPCHYTQMLAYQQLNMQEEVKKKREILLEITGRERVFVLPIWADKALAEQDDKIVQEINLHYS